MDPAALAVREGNAYVAGRPSLAQIRRCVEAELSLPLPTESQRDTLKDMARAYCHTGDAIEAMTDADLLHVWREGFGDEAG